MLCDAMWLDGLPPGVACADGYPMYHTLYDNAHWFEEFADPGFHRILAGQQPLLPFFQSSE